jgi:MYXO-CTERM domain-containing protein
MSNLVVPVATVSTGVTLLAAFLLFGRRRRRDDEEGALVPAAAAAAAYTSVPLASDLMVDPGTGGTDVDLPRWRRPSLMAARKSDPIRTEAAAAASLTFARGSIASAGTERRLVRYRIVRLLDRPDELMGATVGSLDEGDEVEVVESHGLYRRVVTPDGRSGWLHKMTLGDLIEAPEFEAPIESDVLVAYLAARANS